MLDLRDNAGGYLTQAVDIASLFVNSGVLVQIQGNDGPATTKSAAGDAPYKDVPLVVVVNRYTAAAAEVLAASLQDNERADVVGETSMGKGSVQVVRELDFGGAVRYTAAYYLTPQGEPIDNVGIVPQVGVVNGEGEDGATPSWPPASTSPARSFRRPRIGRATCTGAFASRKGREIG